MNVALYIWWCVFICLQSRKEQDTIILPALYQCTCQYKTYFLGGIFAYKGILLLFGLFLAWETRNVTIPALNDSRYIGMSVYNVVVLSIIGAIVAIALDGSMYYEAPYAISSLCLIVCTTATLLLVFVPKVWIKTLGRVLRDREVWNMGRLLRRRLNVRNVSLPGSLSRLI